MKLYQDENYTGALAEFEASYALKPTPSTLQNVALSLKALYRYTKAAETLKALLDRHAAELDEAERATIAQAIDELLSLVGRIAVETTPSNAVVTLDGRALTPAEHAGLDVDVGEHVLGASAPGYAPYRETLRVSAGREPQTVQVSLRPVAGFVKVVSNDRDAAIAIDGQPKAFAAWSGPVAPGRHYVQIYRSGHETFEEVIFVEVGKTVSVSGNPGEPLEPEEPDDEADEPSTSAPPLRAQQGKGFYLLAALSPQRISSSPKGLSHDEDQGGGAALGARAGYRFWRPVALELMLEGGKIDVDDAACIGDSGQSAPCTDTQSYSVRTFRFGPNLRVMSTHHRLRFTAALGLGAVSHSFDFDERPDGGGLPQGTAKAINLYVNVELGGQLNLGNVLLGLGLVGFFDGAANLEVENEPLYPTDTTGLQFFGLSLQGGWSQWSSR